MTATAIELTDAEVEAACGCPNQSCYVNSGEPCVDRHGEVLDHPHAARVKIAVSIERDYRELGGLPEHDPSLTRTRRG